MYCETHSDVIEHGFEELSVYDFEELSDFYIFLFSDNSVGPIHRLKSFVLYLEKTLERAYCGGENDTSICEDMNMSEDSYELLYNLIYYDESHFDWTYDGTVARKQALNEIVQGCGTCHVYQRHGGFPICTDENCMTPQKYKEGGIRGKCQQHGGVQVTALQTNTDICMDIQPIEIAWVNMNNHPAINPRVSWASYRIAQRCSNNAII